MKNVNERHIEAVVDLINSGPYLRLLSMQVRELGVGHCTMDVDLDAKHHNPFGGVHGGVYASIIDTAAFWAAYCDLDEDAGMVSIDLRVDNLATARGGRVVVEGKRLKMGRSIGLAEARVLDPNGRLLAHGTSKLMITHGLQSITQAVAAMGHEPLPPKLPLVA